MPWMTSLKGSNADLRRLALLSHQISFETRIDRSILQTFFKDSFNEDLKFFIEKYQIDGQNLGPWFTPSGKDPLNDPEGLEKQIAKEVKDIKVKHREKSSLSSLTKRVIEQRPPKNPVKPTSPIFSSERIPGMKPEAITRLTAEADSELVPKLLLSG